MVAMSLRSQRPTLCTHLANPLCISITVNGDHMPLKTLSLLFYAAYNAMQPCEVVFQETAKAANPSIDYAIEQPYLEEFAKAACRTSNPDVLWLLAQQETNFRFAIVRENGPTPTIHQGKDAVEFLKGFKAANTDPDSTHSQNIDIGVLQFNWNWHSEGFKNDPMKALSPATQVDYFLQKYGTEIYRRCDDKWVGCYHNQTDKERSTKYQSSVTKKGKTLALRALTFLRDHRKLMSKEEKALLPLIRKEEFYKVFEMAKTFPLPRKQILTFADDRDLRQDVKDLLEGEG